MKSPEVAESKKRTYSYPFGLGAYLMSSCYRLKTENDNNYMGNSNDRKKRSSVNKNEKNITNVYENYCKKYVIEKNKGGQSSSTCTVFYFFVNFIFY
jgi:hypothetical protein